MHGNFDALSITKQHPGPRRPHRLGAIGGATSRDRYPRRGSPGNRLNPAGRSPLPTSTPPASRSATRSELPRSRPWRSPRPTPTSGICPDPDGHLQATGRDAKGRKQYRYHPRWRSVRDENKYERVMVFAEALPGIRARVDSDLARHGLPREKVLAAVVRLLETTLIRVGNDEYARSNKSFGLTTMRNRHVRVGRKSVRFEFRGKKRGDARDRPRRRPAWRGSSSGAATFPVRSCFSTSTPRTRSTTSPRPTSTPTSRRSRGATSRPRTSGPGPEPCWRAWRFRSSRHSTRQLRPRRTSSPRSNG